MSQIPQPWLQSLPEKRVATMQYEEILMYEFLKRRAGKDSNDLTVIFPKGRTISYSQMVPFVEHFAAFLQYIGVKKGDKVALLLPTTLHYIIGHFAIQLIGGIVVRFNPFTRNLLFANAGNFISTASLIRFSKTARPEMEFRKYVLAG